MAHKKGVGSSKNGRESESKRLGVKIFGGQFAKAGNVLVRQRGTRHHPGENVGIGRDHTLFALIDGTVNFKRKKDNKSFVSVHPFEVAKAVAEEILPIISAPPPVAVSVPEEVAAVLTDEPVQVEGHVHENDPAPEAKAEKKPGTAKPRTKKPAEEK